MQEIAFQIAALILLLIFTIISFTQKRVTIISNRFYYYIFIAAYITIVLEILTYFSVKLWYDTNSEISGIIYRIYLAFSIVEIWIISQYIVLNLKVSKKVRLFSLLLSGIPSLAFIIVVSVIPLKIYFDSSTNTLNVIGTSFMHSYIGMLFNIVLTIVLLIRFKGNIKKNRLYTSLLWMSLWILTITLQSFLQGFTMIGLVGSIGVMLLMVRLENADVQRDLSTGAYNFIAMQRYLRELGTTKKTYYITMITNPKQALQLSSHDEDNYFRVSNVLDIVRKKTSGNLFINNNNELFFISLEPNDYDNLKEGFRVLKETYLQEYNTGIDIELVFVNFSSTTEDVDTNDLYYLFKFALDTRDVMNDVKEVTISTSTIFEFKRNREIENCLNDAIEHDKIEIFYQPIFGNKDKKFVSVEALCRMKDDKGRYVPPDIFIGMAEANNQIIKLGRIIFRKVCEFVKFSNLEQLGVKHVEINLSAKQSESLDLSDQLIEIMDLYNINPGLINLEITESSSIHNLRRVQNNMNQLREYGVSFSLDDYGKGEANLNYLIGLPFDIIKVDQFLIRSYFTANIKSKYLIHDTFQTLHRMGYEIVAEGVETDAMLRGINALGADYIQGYYYSKPLPEDEYIDFLRKNNF